MFTVVITEKGGAQRRLQFDKPEITIGRVQGNDIILPKGNVSKRHSRIVLKDQRFIVVDLKSTNGTYVNGRKITSPLVVKGGDKIYIGDFILTLEEQAGGYAEAGPPPQEAMPAPPPPAAEPLPAPPRRTAAGPPPLRSTGQNMPAAQAPPPMQGAPQPRRATGEQMMGAPPPLPPREPTRPPVSEPPPSIPPPGQADRFALDEEPADESIPPSPRVAKTPAPAPLAERQPHAPPPMAASMERAPVSEAPPAPAPRQAPAQPRTAPPAQAAPQPAPRPVSAPPRAPEPEGDTGFRGLMTRLGTSFDVRNSDAAALHDSQRWQQAQGAIDGAIATMTREGQLAAAVDRAELAGAALREAVGLGAIESLLANDAVREIVVESPDRIVADLGNGLQPVAGIFSSAEALLTVARRIVGQTGGLLDPSRPIHEARLPDGTAVMVLQRPVAVRGPVLAIRRTQRRAVGPMDLVQREVLSGEMLDLLRMAVNARRNILVCGTVGSGVTTVLGAIAGLVSESERLVTVENVADLNLGRPVISLTAGAGMRVSMRDLLKQAAWLRPDRLVIDDVQGEEAYEVLVTMAARRDGTLAGLHASSPGDALRHLQVIAALDGRSTSITAMNGLIAEAVHLVVQVQLLADASRRVVAITEVVGVSGDNLQTQDVFVYDGAFVSTGAAPRFLGG